jgi:ABC-type nitrate/sulfonate/bicarbonate transport system substrate-binding protein
MALFKNRKRTYILAGVLAVAAICAISIFLNRGTPSVPKSVVLESTIIATPDFPLSGLVFLAQNKGFFKEEGVDVSFQMHADGKNAMKSMLEGKASFAMVADIPIMHNIMAGKKISIITAVGDTPTDIAIIGRKDKGILKAADLKNKKIGVVPGTTSAYFLDTLLIANDIKSDAVKLVYMTGEKIVDALLSGEVDAVSTWNPLLYNLENGLGDRAIRIDTTAFYKLTWCIVAAEEYTNQHPELIKKILRALIRAEDFGKKYPLELRKTVVESAKMDNRMYDRNIYHFGVRLDQTLLVALEAESRWAMTRHLTDAKEVPNYLKNLYLPGLEAVKPEAITIVR